MLPLLIDAAKSICPRAGHWPFHRNRSGANDDTIAKNHGSSVGNADNNRQRSGLRFLRVPLDFRGRLHC